MTNHSFFWWSLGCFLQPFWSYSELISSSETSASDLMCEVSDPVSLMSINMPDIDVSSNIFIHSDNPLPTSSFDTDSLFSLLDFEAEYYTNWERHYQELLYKILTTHVLNPAPPVPKSSQLHLLDHWRIHSPKHFRRKLCVEPQTFDCLVSCIEDHPVCHNNSNNSQLPIYIQLHIFLFCAGHYCYNFEPLSDNCLYSCSVLGRLSTVYSRCTWF